MTLETSFKRTNVSYDRRGTGITQTLNTLKRVLTTTWSLGYAFSSQAFSRGRGYYDATLTELAGFPGSVGSVAVGLAINAPEDPTSSDPPVTWMAIGIRVEGGTSGGTARGFIIQNYKSPGVELAIDPASWIPRVDDLIQFERADGTLSINIYRAGNLIAIFLTESTADIPSYDVLHPAAAIQTANAELKSLEFIPDGATLSADLGATVGMRDTSIAPMLLGFSGTVSSSNPGYGEQNLGARSAATYISTFDPMTLKFILGIWELQKKPKAHTSLWESSKSLILGEDATGLEVHIANLPIRSKSGRTGLNTHCIAVVPRLQRIGANRLSFTPGYRQPVELRYAEPTQVSDLILEVRNSEGNLARLTGTSCVAIRFTS